jgi:hypothetical protein
MILDVEAGAKKSAGSHVYKIPVWSRFFATTNFYAKSIRKNQ